MKKTMENQPQFLIVDLFCGAGGTTTGFAMANNGIAKVIACVNHDAKAIESHWKNHPEVKHFEEDIRTLDLTELIEVVKFQRSLYPQAKLILWASLECTNFSKAKGGQPRDADSRTLAEHLERYILAINPDYIQIENVVEFMSWGPLISKVTKTDEGFDCCKVFYTEMYEYVLDADGDYVMEEIYENGVYLGNEMKQQKSGEIKVSFIGTPENKKNGQDFVRWKNKVCSHGYRDEWKELNSANFGAYTSRNRLFGVFAKPGLPIAWPQPTHAKNPSKFSMYGDLQKWKAVKEVLDFTDEGESIFNRKKPLSDKTLERIYAGLEKYVAKGDKSFISKYYSGRPAGKVTSVNQPGGTITTAATQALVNASFIMQRNSGNPESKIVNVDGPARTLTSTGGNQDLVQAEFLMQTYAGNSLKATNEPANTITTRFHPHLVQPVCLLKYDSTDKTGKHYPPSVDAPCPVIIAQGRLGIINAQFIQHYYGNGFTTDTNEPCPTLTTKERCALVQPEFLVNFNHSSKSNDINEPSPTLLTRDKLAIAKPEFLSNQNQSINDPAGTVMPNDKHRLVEAVPFIMPTNYDNTPKSVDDPAPTLQASRRHHYIINPSHGGHSTAIDAPCPVVIARQDKAPLYLVNVENGAAAIPLYEDEPEVMHRIKMFMAVFGLVDIKMRMLRVLELLKIQGFPADYVLCGNQSDQKKFIGNSVVPQVVKAWIEAMGEKLISEFKNAA